MTDDIEKNIITDMPLSKPFTPAECAVILSKAKDMEMDMNDLTKAVTADIRLSDGNYVRRFLPGEEGKKLRPVPARIRRSILKVLKVDEDGFQESVEQHTKKESLKPSIPDSLPDRFKSVPYVGNSEDVKLMSDNLRCYPTLLVVTGQAGVGKTARVIEAIEPLWLDGLFPGGRFWIPLYTDTDTSRPKYVVAAEKVARDSKEAPKEKKDDLRAQMHRLLGARSLVLLEGAETVLPAEIQPLIDLFPSIATVVWMSRRQTDKIDPHLRHGIHHHVTHLTPSDALKLLCKVANVSDLTETEQKSWKDIADAAVLLPLFLRWAGLVLKPVGGVRLISATEYLSRLKDDPLDEIADPDQRELSNARRFLRRSLERIMPTTEMPRLQEMARRLFTCFGAFHPGFGAPKNWWQVAVGLDTTSPIGKRLLYDAIRSLLIFELVTAKDAGDDALEPIHALARAVAIDMWRRENDQERADVLNRLCEAGALAFDTPPPTEWFCDVGWVAVRIAEAAHFGHWIEEVKMLNEGARCKVFSTEEGSECTFLEELCSCWMDFLQTYASSQPLPTLKETAWSAVCRCQEEAVKFRPTLKTRAQFADALVNLGTVRRARRDWQRAENSYSQALQIYQELTITAPARPEFQLGLAKSWARLGAVHRALEDWEQAEKAFDKAMALSSQLVADDPVEAEYQHTLASAWLDLGGTRRARCDWKGTDEAFNKGLKLCLKLVEGRQESREFQRELLRCWTNLVRLRKAQNDWSGAEEAWHKAKLLGEQLLKDNPGIPEFQHMLVVSWSFLGDIRSASADLHGAEEAYVKAYFEAEKLATNHRDMPDYENTLFIAWADLGVVRREKGELVRALEAFERALEICHKLEQAYGLSRYKNSLAMTFSNLGSTYQKQVKLMDAANAFDQAMAIRKSLAEKFQNLPEYQQNLADSWVNASEIHVAQREFGRAKKALEEASAIYTRLALDFPQATNFQRVSRELVTKIQQLSDLGRFE